MEKNKLRVAFFGDDFSRKGKGTALVIQKIAEELLMRHSHEVEIVLIRPPGECRGSVCDKARSVIVPQRFSTLLSYLWFFIIHRDRYDVIVFNRVVYPGFWFLRAKRRILFVYDASISEVYFVERTWINLVFEYLLRSIGQYFLDVVIAVSDDARKHVITYFKLPTHKVRTLYPGATDGFRTYSESERYQSLSVLEKKYGVRSPYIVDVSRFDPHKNIHRMLEAFFMLKEKHQIPHKLVFVGGAHTPDYSKMILGKISASRFANDVLIVDYIDDIDMPALYNCADVVAYPSLVEGFGMPLLEAMRCGTPVVTSNISCLPEIAAGAALLVDPLSPESIAEGILKVQNDSELRAELVAKGLRRAAVFDWTKSTEMFLGYCK